MSVFLIWLFQNAQMELTIITCFQVEIGLFSHPYSFPLSLIYIYLFV